jgi:hypothetical protein
MPRVGSAPGSGVIGIRAEVLSPLHYHSLAVPGGTATQPDYLTDRQVAFALGAALGCLSYSWPCRAKITAPTSRRCRSLPRVRDPTPAAAPCPPAQPR